MNETQLQNQKVLETVNICSNEERSNPASQEKEMVKLVGITTSQIQQALKGSKTQGQYPYPARVFLKVEGKEDDIPIVFRIRCREWLKTGSCCEWAKPKIKKGSYLSCQGTFADQHTGSFRKSFTAYSYQLITPPRKEVFSYYE